MTEIRESSLRSAAGRWLLLALLALLLAACNRNQDGTPTSELLSSYLPADWKPLTEGTNVKGFQKVNIDGDEADEWLYFFHYDGQGDANGPVGGIIYDAQQNVDPNQPAAFFVPYRLLPDWREGKGQGYLGETTVSWSKLWTDPRDAAGSADELMVIGLSTGGVPTRLSLFRWQGEGAGYGVAHFVGNGGVLTLPEDRAENALVEKVITFNRLNDRSRLCEQVEYTRQDADLSFAATPPSILFCPLTADGKAGVPDVPTYPEAVVMAWLLGERSPDLALDNAALNAALPEQVQRVMHVQYPGVVSPVGRGEFVAQIVVQTVLATSAGERTLQWTVVELRPNATEKTSRWRIASVE
ncbi:MAG: hypothetical protein WA040_05735 [Anaerolineae bacterium]